jgi:hypothetical protein
MKIKSYQVFGLELLVNFVFYYWENLQYLFCLGAGRLGRQLAHTLLEFGDVNPSELGISTRQPEILS